MSQFVTDANCISCCLGLNVLQSTIVGQAGVNFLCEVRLIIIFPSHNAYIRTLIFETNRLAEME